jgi:dihydroorotate dehydrogenase (NAD+) catalytic subunit
MAAKVVAAARRKTRLCLIPKLPPNVPNIADFARAVEAEGADAISLINSVPAMVIDVETRKPLLANVTGGLTGPAVHPIAVKLVYEAARAVKIPVIGMGGITGPEEALEFLIAGASAVAVGTANFTDPRTPLLVADGIERYLKNHGIRRVSDLVGTLQA